MYPSNKAYNPRAFDSFWKPFVRVSQAFCVSHYSIWHQSKNGFRLIYFILFGTLHISLIIYTLTNGPYLHVIVNDKYKRSSLMFYVSLMSIIGNLIAHMMAHLEPLFTKKHELEMYRKLREIDEIFATKLNYVTDFSTIRNEFIKYTVSFYIFAASLSFGYSIFTLPDDAISTAVFLLNRLIAVFVIRVRRCLIAFHVNTMTNILRDVQILLKQQQLNYRPNSTETVKSRENIQYLRDIYSNVWLLKNLLSSCFGWSFISFLAEFTFELINSSYWVYINVQTFKSTVKVSRKSIFAKTTIINWNFNKTVCISISRDFLLHNFKCNCIFLHLHDLWTLWTGGRFK